MLMFLRIFSLCFTFFFILKKKNHSDIVHVLQGNSFIQNERQKIRLVQSIAYQTQNCLTNDYNFVKIESIKLLYLVY